MNGSVTANGGSSSTALMDFSSSWVSGSVSSAAAADDDEGRGEGGGEAWKKGRQ